MSDAQIQPKRERGIDPNDGVAAIYESRSADKRAEIFGAAGSGRE